MAHFPSSDFALSVVCLLCLGACASKPPTSLSINVAAVDAVNPDIYGRPSPIVTRVYELSGTDRISKSDIFQLLDHDKEVLGSDLLDRSELILQPGESRTIKMPVKDGAKYLAVVAGYRDVDHADWRSVTQMPMSDDVSTLITVGRLSAKIEETERK